MKPLLSLITIITFLCVSASSAAENDDLKAKIQKLNEKAAKAIVSGNIDESIAVYAEDAVSLPNYAPMLKGKEAIKRHSEEMKNAGFKFHSFDFITERIQTAGDFVHEIGTYKLSMTVPGVPEKVSDNGKYLTIWKKEKDGSLKVVIDTWNTDKFPLAPPQ